MLLYLLDNGLNSLKVGLDFYSKFLFEDNIELDLEDYFGNLKFAVIAIQNSVELIMKKLLSNINDLLIYEINTIENPDLLRYIGRKYQEKGNGKIGLDYFFASYEDRFCTISYNKCIERLALCYSLEEHDIQTLTKLGYYRNILTHFGLENIFGYERIMFNLNDTLTLIYNKLIRLTKRESIYEDFDILDIIVFLEKAEAKTHETWFACKENLIDHFNEALNCLVNDTTLFEEHFDTIKSVNLENTSEYNWISEINISFVNNQDFNLTIEHIPYMDISVLLHGQQVFGFIDYDQFLDGSLEKLYMFIPTKIIGLNEIIRLKSKEWKANQYSKMELNNKAIINNYKLRF